MARFTQAIFALLAATLANALPIHAAAPQPRPDQTGRDTPPPRRSRAISSEAAAALAAAAPKYTPPPPKPEPKPEPPAETADMREVDKPQNTIIRLPKYIVREKKPVFLSERAVHTDKGLADIAMRRYISEADKALNRWSLPLFGSSTEARALAMYAEDERLGHMKDLKDAATNTGMTDSSSGTYIMRESQKTFLRTSDFGWSSGDPR